MKTIVESALNRFRGNEEEVDKRAVSLFKPEMLDRIKESKFSGRLEISWMNGEVRSCSLSSRIDYRITKVDDDDDRFTCGFG